MKTKKTGTLSEVIQAFAEFRTLKSKNGVHAVRANNGVAKYYRYGRLLAKNDGETLSFVAAPGSYSRAGAILDGLSEAVLGKREKYPFCGNQGWYWSWHVQIPYPLEIDVATKKILTKYAPAFQIDKLKKARAGYKVCGVARSIRKCGIKVPAEITDRVADKISKSMYIKRTINRYHWLLTEEVAALRELSRIASQDYLEKHRGIVELSVTSMVQNLLIDHEKRPYPPIYAFECIMKSIGDDFPEIRERITAHLVAYKLSEGQDGHIIHA